MLIRKSSRVCVVILGYFSHLQSSLPVTAPSRITRAVVSNPFPAGFIGIQLSISKHPEQFHCDQSSRQCFIKLSHLEILKTPLQPSMNLIDLVIFLIN